MGGCFPDYVTICTIKIILKRNRHLRLRSHLSQGRSELFENGSVHQGRKYEDVV